MTRQCLRSVIVLFTCLTSTQVLSEDDCSWDGCNWQGNWEQGAIFGGGAIAFFDSDARFGLSALNTYLDLEDDVGLDKTSGSIRLGGYYRLGRRHRFDIEYYEYDRDATSQIRAGINVRDRFIGIDETVKTKFDLHVIKADYQFNAWKTDTLELGLMVGIYGATIESKVEAPGRGVSQSIDDFVPMPLFGVRITNALTDKLSVSTSFQYFAAEIDDWSGSLQEFWFGVEYNIWEHVGAGISYDLIAGEIENKDRSGRNGQLNLDFSSVYLYGKLFF